MSVLKSLTGYQMYRRHMQVAVRRIEVLQFLLQNRQFPRACYHCLGEAEACLRDLPRSEPPLRTLAGLQRALTEAHVHALDQERLHAFIDELQLGLAELHQSIHGTYFALEPSSPPRHDTALA